MNLGEVYGVLPDALRYPLQRVPEPVQAHLEEIRIRVGRPLEIGTSRGFYFVGSRGGIDKVPRGAVVPTPEDGKILLGRLSQHSLYALEEELQSGFLTLAGGHRVGLTGRTVGVVGGRYRLRDITGFNIRIARSCPHCSRSLLPHLVQNQRLHNTLLLSPPQAGKTTLLRDLARSLSLGSSLIPSLKVSMVDERSELAGCYAGIPQYDIGPRTDVLDGCPKMIGLMMLIRSMSPEVLVIDELGHPSEIRALHEASQAGVRIVATAHAFSYRSAKQRPSFSPLFQSKIFTRIVLLSRREGPGTVERIYDHLGQEITGGNRVS
ncbi:stage III sporulation protein AA [Pasteuria penetrans]|uniref:stage III sporulation protein AA n=1 Tax=Pasteuria penetrans TaxID=86005 RepID=UPI000FADD74C|nr:stage III sporulation protein AA [Pasteuria penetrans]